MPSEERGVFKSTDGGDSWERILFRDERTGAIDLALDRNNPDVLYASLWEAFRKEYTMSSGGPGSGMFKSVDGGMTWTEMTRNPGMPPEGVVGRIGIAVSSANSGRVYALFEHDDGGLFRSDDGGDSWELINDERRIRQRAFYYTHVFADHHDEDVVYVQNTSFFRSTDGGATYEVINNGTHGDFHDFWIDPDDPAHVVVANDGGGAVSFTTGSEWTDLEFSTAQFYHGVTTAHIPFHICGSQQDNSTLCLPSDWNAGRFASALADTAGDSGARAPDITAGSMDVFYRSGGGEPGYIADGKGPLPALDHARRALLDDFRPQIWKTDDFGDTWSRIVDGIRDDAYVNSVREDPNRAGLLYAGTNHGVYISYDDGGSWQELNPDLPDMPITDVIPEHDELAMASHGRGFWILDNVAPLRQLTPETTAEDLVLFDPAAAYRSANGVVLSWWLGDEPGDAMLEIMDASGDVVRTFEPGVEGEERDRWAGPALPMAAGLNRLRWDLRTDPAASFPGMILWGVGTLAPAVPPGTYTARLTVDGRSETTEVEVRRHPWITDVTEADLVAQYEFGVQIRDRVHEPEPSGEKELAEQPGLV